MSDARTVRPGEAVTYHGAPAAHANPVADESVRRAYGIADEINEWIFVAWHLKGAAGTFDQWMRIPVRTRALIVTEIKRRVIQGDDRSARRQP